MRTKDTQRKSLKHSLLSCVAVGAMISNAMAPIATAVAAESAPKTPIKHVIIIIGENRTFDHIFATYKPMNKGETVLNLLSEGIVNADGSPGPNYHDALQYQASDSNNYNLTPPKSPYVVLPPALVGGTSTPYVCKILGITTGTSCDSPANETAAATIENGLANGYYEFLLTGGTGQTNKTPDQRIFYDGQGAKLPSARSVPAHVENIPL